MPFFPHRLRARLANPGDRLAIAYRTPDGRLEEQAFDVLADSASVHGMSALCLRREGEERRFDLTLLPSNDRGLAVALCSTWERFASEMDKQHGFSGAAPAVLGLSRTASSDAIGLLIEHVETRGWKLELEIAGQEETEVSAKRRFLASAEQVLRDMGHARLARRYRPKGWLSPLRVGKRLDAGPRPDEGLIALDWPAGCLSTPRSRTAGSSDARTEISLRLIERGRPRSRLDERSIRQRPLGFKALFDASARRAWLFAGIEQADREGMLEPGEADRLRQQADNPYIRAYLLGLAVHIATLPFTGLVVFIGSLIYAMLHGRPLTTAIEYMAVAGAFFSVSPISPGSLLRGTIVLIYVLTHRQWGRFKIALLCSFWRYIGLSAFPLQMVATFPQLARLLAAQAARRLTSFVPILGRRGGRLEYAVFDLFFNWPLRLRGKAR